MNPVILMSSGTEERAKGPRYVQAVWYARCLSKCGALPLIDTDAGERLDKAASCLAARCDALLLSGGGDIDPCFYGEKPLTDTLSLDLKRDRREFALLNAFFSVKKPVLGICRGMQVIGVFFGGSAYQDLPAQLGCCHQDTCHAITLSNGSLLKSLFPAESLMVNSYHHQAMRTAGETLSVSARDADGVIEGIESTDKRVCGVQWHPERMVSGVCQDIDGGASMLPLFDWLCKLA